MVDIPVSILSFNDVLPNHIPARNAPVIVAICPADSANQAYSKIVTNTNAISPWLIGRL